MTKGEFAFILSELSANNVQQKMQHPWKWFVAHYLNTFRFWREVREEFGSVLVLGPKAPQSDYSEFEKKLKERMSEAPFFSTAYNGSISGTEKDKSQSRVSSLCG